MTKTLNDNEKLGLWYSARLNSVWSWSVAFIVAMGSIRGLLVINLDAPAAIVYMLTAGSLLSLAAYGWITRGRYRHPNLIWLKNLLNLNMLLGIVNEVVDRFLGVPFDPSVLYLYLAPYVVFIFLRVPSYYFNVVIIVVTIAISYSVCINFFDTLQGPEGVEKVFEYNQKLRPEVFNAFSRSGEFYRVGGYTGSYHDSANILGMASSFLFIRFLLKKKLFDLELFVVATLSLLLTQSAANIIVAVSTISFFSGYILIRSRKLKTFLYLLLGLASLIVLSAFFGDVMSIFLSRVDEEDLKMMTQQLDKKSLLSAIPLILIGHGTGFGSGSINTEIGLIKGILQWGIVHAIIVYWILLYPVFRFVKIRSICSDALPSAAAIFFGFMSLLHYGSLFRVTSIFLFFAFYAICLNNIIHCRNSMRLSDSLRHEPVVKK